jgi:hypothetical protein
VSGEPGLLARFDVASASRGPDRIGRPASTRQRIESAVLPGAVFDVPPESRRGIISQLLADFSPDVREANATPASECLLASKHSQAVT